MIDWDDPVARYHLVEEVGTERYNELIQQHFRDSTVATVNGYPIRPVGSRFGTIFMIDGANIGFKTQPEAEAHAATLPPKSAD
jgi:hypothetical protein